MIYTSWEYYTRLAGLIEYVVDCAEGVREWEIIKICLRWENASVALAEIFNPRIYSCEVGKYVEATQGRQRRELLRSSSDCYLAVGDVDATDEDVKAVFKKGRIKVVQCCFCKVVQGQQTGRGMKRCLKRPRDAA